MTWVDWVILAAIALVFLGTVILLCNYLVWRSRIRHLNRATQDSWSRFVDEYENIHGYGQPLTHDWGDVRAKGRGRSEVPKDSA